MSGIRLCSSEFAEGVADTSAQRFCPPSRSGASPLRSFSASLGRQSRVSYTLGCAIAGVQRDGKHTPTPQGPGAPPLADFWKQAKDGRTRAQDRDGRYLRRCLGGVVGGVMGDVVSDVVSGGWCDVFGVVCNTCESKPTNMRVMCLNA